MSSETTGRRTCVDPTCSNTAQTRTGLCNTHAKQAQPALPLPKWARHATPIERFEATRPRDGTMGGWTIRSET